MEPEETTTTLHIPSCIVNPTKLPQATIMNPPKTIVTPNQQKLECIQENSWVIELGIRYKLFFIWVTHCWVYGVVGFQ